MKKLFLIIIALLMFININDVYAEKYCKYVYNNEVILTVTEKGGNKINYTITFENENYTKDLETTNIEDDAFYVNGNFSCLDNIYILLNIQANNKREISFSTKSYADMYNDPESGVMVGNVPKDSEGNTSPVENNGFQQGDLDCNGFLAGDFGRLIKKALNLIKYLVPVIIIIMTIKDYMQAVISQDQKEINKATQKLVKRLIIGVIIFLLPTLLNVVLDIAGIPYGTCSVK